MALPTRNAVRLPPVGRADVKTLTALAVALCCAVVLVLTVPVSAAHAADEPSPSPSVLLSESPEPTAEPTPEPTPTGPSVVVLDDGQWQFVSYAAITLVVLVAAGVVGSWRR